eukprot:TCONS_00071016-protein
MDPFKKLALLKAKMTGMSRAQIAEAIRNMTLGINPTEQEPDLTTPQNQPLQGQSQNAAGGFSYTIDNITRLKRYLILGSDKAKYKGGSQAENIQNIPVVEELLKEGKGKEVIDLIVQFAREARISKEENILMVLRDCMMYQGDAMYEDRTIQRAAYDSIVKICNIPTKLFRLMELCKPCYQNNWKPLTKPVSKTQLRKKAKQEAKQAAQQQNQRPSTSTEIPAAQPPSAKVPVETCEIVEEGEPPKKKKKKMKKKKKPKEPKPQTTQKFKKSSSWGRARRRGVGNFYTDSSKDANRLLLLMTKYKQRHNWNHVQTLGYCHPKMTGDEEQVKNIVLQYCTRGKEKLDKYLVKKKIDGNQPMDPITSQILQHIKVLEEVKNLKPDVPADVERLLQLLHQYGIREVPQEFEVDAAGQMVQVENTQRKKCSFQLTREHLPNGFQKLKEVWVALLQDMPMTALIRNLGKMTSLGLFDDPANREIVKKVLGDGSILNKARIHPVKILLASKMYEQGHGDQGQSHQPQQEYPTMSLSQQLRQQRQRQQQPQQPQQRVPTKEPLTWIPNAEISKALNDAFYLSFRQPGKNSSFRTDKKFMLNLDVSGSMDWRNCVGCDFLTPAAASFALAMITMKVEPHCSVFAFGRTLQNIDHLLKRDMTIREAIQLGRSINFGATDCALPMVHATQNRLDVDVFIVYTDSETWVGKVHPSEALKNYRLKMNKPDAKLIVMAMQVNDFTIADPLDRGMFDVCGFDSNVPDMICEIARGNMS